MLHLRRRDRPRDPIRLPAKSRSDPTGEGDPGAERRAHGDRPVHGRSQRDHRSAPDLEHLECLIGASGPPRVAVIPTPRRAGTGQEGIGCGHGVRRGSACSSSEHQNAPSSNGLLQLTGCPRASPLACDKNHVHAAQRRKRRSRHAPPGRASQASHSPTASERSAGRAQLASRAWQTRTPSSDAKPRQHGLRSIATLFVAPSAARYTPRLKSSSRGQRRPSLSATNALGSAPRSWPRSAAGRLDVLSASNVKARYVSARGAHLPLRSPPPRLPRDESARETSRGFRAKEQRSGLEPNARRRSEAGLGSLVPRHGMSAALLAASSVSCPSRASPRSRPPCAGGSRVPAGWS